MKEVEIVSVSPSNNKNGVVVKQDGQCCGSTEGSPTDTITCGCSGSSAESSMSAFHWIVGKTMTSAGEVPVVKSRWTWRERLGQFRCRIGGFRMHYAVPPGLYAVGNPGRNAEVLVSANYKLSFDLLRRSLEGIDAWILVIDTKGINVWCAAGKGTFGTDELISRIVISGLERVVAHRRLIVPQLGAPGTNAWEVEKKTGFRVHFGPVRSDDIPEYLKDGLKKSSSMSTVTFSFIERLILTPIEMIPALKALLPAAVVVTALLGLERQGIMFGSAANYGLPVVAIGLCAVLCGALLTPILLPLLPGRSFAFKGLIVGLAAVAVLHGFTGFMDERGWIFTAFTWLFLPLVSSYLSLQFTGATVFTGMSGVKKEIRITLPLYIAGTTVSLALLVMYKCALWGIL